MKILEKLLKNNTVTVEQIHEEFDTAQERILQECDSILASLQIPTETQLENKAKKLKELGFINSEPVKQLDNIVSKQIEVKSKLELTSKQAKYIRELSVKYPLEKFITIDELNRICDKYNLIHAPVANYIKDIPEKNVLEMSNVKKLDVLDKVSILYKFSCKNNEKQKRFKIFLDSINKSDGIFYKGEDVELLNQYKGNGYFYSQNPWGIKDETWTFVIWQKTGEKGSYSFDQIEKIDKSGLFIAAPQSHFNLTGLNKKTKHGYFNVKSFEVKDPVVFEYCKNDICRIITKWGTDDDQSYLDPIVTNENLN